MKIGIYMYVYGMKPMGSHVVEDTQNDTEQHLSYAQDDGHLHLVGVGEDQLVLCILPNLGGSCEVR